MRRQERASVFACASLGFAGTMGLMASFPVAGAALLGVAFAFGLWAFVVVAS